MIKDNNAAEPATGAWLLTTQEKERSRLVADGRCTDNGERCTLVVVHEAGGSWAWYPHGFGKFGVRLPRAEAVKLARSILDGAA
jgi:hypothetical protein